VQVAKTSEVATVDFTHARGGSGQIHSQVCINEFDSDS